MAMGVDFQTSRLAASILPRGNVGGGMAPKKIDALIGLRFIAAAVILVPHAGIFRVAVPPFCSMGSLAKEKR